jgi:endonuclease/exonuclease/phosphatase family metal-dependent hydrolase
MLAFCFGYIQDKQKRKYANQLSQLPMLTYRSLSRPHTKMNLKIATYNVQFGLKTNLISDNIQKLAASGVSVFCLQEVKEFEGRRLLKTILEKLGPGWESDTFIRSGSHDLGLATLWRPDVLQLRDSNKLLLPKLEKFSLYELTARKLALNFVNTTVQRGALINTFHFQGQLIRICNLHLDCAGRFAQRAKQLNFLVSYLQSLPQINYKVVCGDFNTIGVAPFTKRQEQKVRAILGPSFVNAHPQALPTQKNLLQRLDYIFVSGAQVQKAQVSRMRGSDHFPLIANLEV